MIILIFKMILEYSWCWNSSILNYYGVWLLWKCDIVIKGLFLKMKVFYDLELCGNERIVIVFFLWFVEV